MSLVSVSAHEVNLFLQHVYAHKKIFPTRPHKRACIETHACTGEAHMEINDVRTHTRIRTHAAEKTCLHVGGGYVGTEDRGAG